MSPLLATPFHARAAAANRLNAWENRCGFTLATHYGNVAEEALAARFGAVLGDLSWQWRVELVGEQAPALVSRLFTRDASALGLGAAMEVLWLNDAGAVRGQGTVVRLAPDRFRLVAAFADADWIADAARIFGVAVEDRKLGVLALIGPAAAKILKAAGLDADLPPLSFRQMVWRGLEVSLSRLSLGFAIVCDPDCALIVWDRLMAAGRGFALMPAGQAALDILEIESGVLRPGRDYTPCREGFETAPSPQSLGLCGLIDRAHLFNGRAGYLAAGPDAALCGVLFDGEAPAPNTLLTAGDAVVGSTLASCFSPVLRRAIALAVLAEPWPGGPLHAIMATGKVVGRPVGLPFLPIPAPATETAGVGV